VNRVAAIYDIHANLPSLEAVLLEIRACDVDLIVVGGDVLPGPMPRETLECLLALDTPVRFLMGNGDRETVATWRGEVPKSVPEPVRPVVRWNAEQLAPQAVSEIETWPPTISIDIDGIGLVLFCHATPRNDTDIFTRLTPEERLAPIFDGVNAALVVCGHTHMQFDRTIGRTRVVNAGSVGMAFGAPGAYWLLLAPDATLRRTAYDPEKAAERIKATQYPQANEFAEQNVLKTPSESDVLAAFARAELKSRYNAM